MFKLAGSVHNEGIRATSMPSREPFSFCPVEVTVLAVSPHPEDHRRLSDIFGHSRWSLKTAASVSEAKESLAAGITPVLVCEYALPDGTWRDLFDLTARWPNPPRFLVSRRAADERTWAEVLDYGGYDCLPKPFQADEVYRLVSLAWRSWKDQFERAQHAAHTGAAGVHA